MAVINVTEKEDFIRVIREDIPPKAYKAVTDELTYVWLVPKVTSRHRHYYRLDLKDEGEWEEIKKELIKAGIGIIRGHVSFPPT